MRKILKLRSRREGGHIHVSVFMGNEGQTLHRSGVLVFDYNPLTEWQLFGAALFAGQDIMRDHLKVVGEGWNPDQEEDKK